MLCSSSHSGSLVRMNTPLAAALTLICALTACAAERASEPPPATAATEPEQKTSGGADAEGLPPTDPASLKKVHRALDETASTSEQLADKTAAQADYASEHGGVPGTPQEQQTDLERAAAIRRALIEANGLSAGARNVNVLVEQGRVTLRGRVESAVERARVEETARLAVGSTSIVNELEVPH
jgi:hypothetical protein